jgi:protein phosphatase
MIHMDNASVDMPPSAGQLGAEDGSIDDLITEMFDLEEASGELPTILMPSRLLSVEAAGITDVGQNRQHNEDFFVIDNRVTHLCNPDSSQVYARGLYILCDGMGGHDQGEVASRMAAETLALHFAEHWQVCLPSEAEIRDAILQTNQTLYDLNESQTRLGPGRMGTTMVLALLQDKQLRFAHVGDSRLYQFTYCGGLKQLTIDHEVGQRDIARGIKPKVAYARPSAYQLTQAMGPRAGHCLNLEVQDLTLNEDCLFLLCSDGMSDNHLLERYWETHLRPLLNFQIPLDEGLYNLVALANAENGHDNISVVGVRVKLSGQGFSLAMASS